MLSSDAVLDVRNTSMAEQPVMAELSFHSLVNRLAACLCERGQRLVCAESCTGGWLAKVCTDLPGSSVWFHGGLVTYSNETKSSLLGIAPERIARHGAVSAEVAGAMAAGALRAIGGDWSVAITGVAGPDGGSAEKPVGTVFCAWAGPGHAPQSHGFRFGGDREAVRAASVAAALAGLLERVSPG